MTEATYGGYTLDELKKAFDKVSDPEDWKGPIRATMPGEAVGVTCAAIEFYTATKARVRVDSRQRRGKYLVYFVESKGYRAGPAGDH